MKFRIRSHLKLDQLDVWTMSIRSHWEYLDEILEFDHVPSDEEVQIAIERLPKFYTYIVHWNAPIQIAQVYDEKDT